MEKLKRQPQQRPFFSLVFFLVIFVLGFALGIFAFNAYQNAGEVGATVSEIVSDNNCSPVSHQYAEQSVATATYEAMGGVASGQTVPQVAMQTTSSAPLLIMPSSTPAASGGQNAPVPTSVAVMEANPLNLQAGTPLGNTVEQEVMVIPATYTPMPMGTSEPMMGIASTGGSYAANTALNPLKAGEINDNVEWDVYLTYRNNFAEGGSLYSPIHDVDVYRRLLIQVVNEQSEGILGATVEVYNMQGMLIQTSCTYADGFTMFLPNAYPETQQENTFRLHVSKNDRSFNTDVTISSERFTNNFISVQLDTEQPLRNLDILFLIDASGSMDDEIAAITNNIVYISEQIHALPDSIDVRYALVSFKDGNYPTQVWDFTPDVNLFQSQLATLYTAGGDGETLNDGLDRSIHQVSWRGDDTVKLVFLVGDEPPGEYAQHPNYSISMLDALYTGIKIHPIASSGLDLKGEYIFRQIAQASMGSFIFMSYDTGATAIQSGSTNPVNGSMAEEAAGQYNVEQLHEIVLNLIREELGFAAEQ